MKLSYGKGSNLLTSFTYFLQGNCRSKHIFHPKTVFSLYNICGHLYCLFLNLKAPPRTTRPIRSSFSQKRTHTTWIEGGVQFFSESLKVKKMLCIDASLFDLARPALCFARFADSAGASPLLLRAITKAGLPSRPRVTGRDPSAFLKAFPVFSRLRSHIFVKAWPQMETFASGSLQLFASL